MELKKSEEANSDRLRYPMIFVGLLFTGSLVLASFTYTSPAAVVDDTVMAERDGNDAFDPEVKADEPEDQPEPQQADVTPPPQEEIKKEETAPVTPPKQPTPPPPPPMPPGNQPVKKVDAEIFDFPDVDASFPGGAAAMKKWIQENVQYPELSKELGDQGKVYVTFVVEPDGTITGIDVVRKVTEELDREAKRLVRNMPKWDAGEVKGAKVRSRCRLPITFTLQ